jgi:hypothetical protein
MGKNFNVYIFTHCAFSEMLTAGYIVVNILAIMLVNGQTQLCMLPTRLPYRDNCMGNRVISTSHLRASTSFRWGAAAHRTILQLHHSTTAPQPCRIFYTAALQHFQCAKSALCTTAPLWHCTVAFSQHSIYAALHLCTAA